MVTENSCFISERELGKRLPHFMKVLTRFNEGLNKVFQVPFEYAPPQGQESCKTDLSRNCTVNSFFNDFHLKSS